MSELPAMVFVFLSVGAVALFSFIAVSAWADARRKEREAYYRSEVLKKIAETQGGSAVVDLFREEYTREQTKHREGLKLGGLINIAVGVGLMVFLAFQEGAAVSLVGLIPLLIGVVLAAYGWLSGRGEPESHPSA
jgi:hypothetical protein